MPNIGKIVADVVDNKPPPMAVPDDLMALSRQVGEEVSDKQYIKESAAWFRTKALVNRDGSLRSGSEESGPGIAYLKELAGKGDIRNLSDAVRNVRSHQFTKDGSGVGGTPLMEEALTKPGWQHSGRQVKIVHMSPMEYIARSAKGHGLTQEQLMAQLAQGDRTDQILQGMAEGKRFDLPYLDYRNGGFGQEGQHRAMAAAMTGQEKIPVAVLWDDVRTPVAAKAGTFAGATGAAVGLSQPDSAQASPLGTLEQEFAQIASDEGTVHEAYLDTRGLLTAGIGHLLTPEEQKKYPVGTKVPDEQVQKWWEEDRQKHMKDLDQWDKAVPNLPDEVRKILFNMSFNMGPNRFSPKKWPGLTRALKAGDWEKAADEMVNSDWFGQVGDRSRRLVDRMRRTR